MEDSVEIIVVGAGVLGLSAALALSENLLSPHKITIVAKHFPDDYIYNTDYTSPWAGAHFRPAPIRNKAEQLEQSINRLTQKRFLRLAQSEPESSVRFMEGIEYLEKSDGYAGKNLLGWANKMDGFGFIPKRQLPPGVKLGAQYKTWVLNPPVYLQWLQRKLRFQYNVKFVKADLVALRDARAVCQAEPGSIIVNCSGYGLQYHGGYDPNVFLVRGQTLVVNPPPGKDRLKNATVTHQLQVGLWTFTVPRPLYGGIVIGGTKQPGDTLKEPRKADTKAILERAALLFPSLQKTTLDGERYFDVVLTNVGFRPARKGGLRLEVERVEDDKVVHAYGAGGAGFELSYGVGMRVYDMVNDILDRDVLVDIVPKL